MENKVELKKAIVYSVLIIIFFAVLYGLFEFYKYKVYTSNLNNKIGQIVTKVKEEYPDISNDDLIQIINNEKKIDNNWFKNYGIDINKENLIIKSKKDFIKFSVINLVILIVLSIIILFIFLKYNYSKDKKLKEITNYIEEINNRNYKLDISENSEDELSILKNEIYKTTVMLKEIAENEISDKLSLKDSLSDISHQLKTPLASITIMLDNIIDNPEMDKNIRNEFIKDIKREIININFFVNSLLKLSKLDSNSVKFINKETYISDILDEAIKNVSVLCDLKNVEILRKRR